MPSAKRSRDRITSGNWRPSKTLRFGQSSNTGTGTGTGSEDEANEDDDMELELEQEPPFNTISHHQDHYDTDHTINPPHVPRMKVSQIVAWPNSLAAIRTTFHHNLTPQLGPLLPSHIITLVSSRIRRPFSPDNNIAPHAPPIPYLHLGSTPSLDLQVYIFLPNLHTSACYAQNPGRIYEFVLERWTNDVFLTAIHHVMGNSFQPWHHVKDRISSDLDIDIDTDDHSQRLTTYPASILPSTALDAIWQRVQHLSMKVPEFQHSFLLLYSAGEFSLSSNAARLGPEEFIGEFETAWLGAVDMKFIAAEEDLKVEFDYGFAGDVRSLVMR